MLVSNLTDKEVILPADCQLGHVAEAYEDWEDEVNVLEQTDQELNEEQLNEWRAYIIENLKLDDNELLKDKPEIREKIIQIFIDNRSALSINDHDYGLTRLLKFHIEVQKGAQPVHARVRPLNPVQEAGLKQQLDDWMKAGVIEKAMSPWAAAVVPCKKKGTTKLRFAMDYRQLNAQTVKDAFPLPNIEANLHKLTGSSVFSCLDAAAAFHNILVDENSRDYTAFVTPFGQFRFVRLPFGLANAPAAYSRLVQIALERLPPGFCLAYIDDIICHSASVEEHVDHLRQVAELHAACGMKLNLRKCQVMQSKVEYLGHLVSSEGISMIPSYVDKILEWKLPSTGTELKSFLGFCGYYRSFIKDFAHLTCEMQKMKNAKGAVEWTDETQSQV